MALLYRRIKWSFLTNRLHFSHNKTNSNVKKWNLMLLTKRFSFFCGFAGISWSIYNYYRGKVICENQKILASTNEDTEKIKKMSSREKRFLAFASVEFNGQIYMTPQDFLESVTQDSPRFRKRRNVLSKKEASDILHGTPSRWWTSSSNLFRGMSENGIISYTEYLFLLCILTKPKSGFRIAFNMFDTDMNEKVDKKEFLVMERVMRQSQHHSSHSSSIGNAANHVQHRVASNAERDEQSGSTWWFSKLINKILSKSVGLTTQQAETDQPKDKDNDMSASEESVQDTTLLRYFFGKSGRDKLTFKEFSKFMDNLQTEVLEIEFMEYSKGLRTISESEFGLVLLRYTKVKKADYEIYLQRIRDKIVKEEGSERGINFNDFCKFFLFLNNLDDFTLAMNMHVITGRPISQEEFQRVVKACVGYTLNPHLVETVFLIFDQDGDGHLSHHEFICHMKDRLVRGLSSSRYNASSRWEAYKYCIKDVVRDQSSHQ